MAQAHIKTGVQWILAAVGVATLVVAVGAGSWWLLGGDADGPGDLALHPHRQDEINAQREAAALAEKLSLSPEQTTQVAAIQLRHREALAALRADPPQELAARAFTRLQAVLARNQAIAQVLTPAQRETFDAMQQEQVQRIVAAREIMQRRRAESGREPLLSEGNRNALLQQFLQARQAQTNHAEQGATP